MSGENDRHKDCAADDVASEATINVRMSARKVTPGMFAQVDEEIPDNLKEVVRNLGENISTALAGLGDVLVDEVNDAINKGNHQAAMEACVSGPNAAYVSWFTSPHLLDAMLLVQLADPDSELAREFLLQRIVAAQQSGRWPDVAPDAHALLQNPPKSQPGDSFAPQMRLVVANAHARAGRRESAQHSYRAIIDDVQAAASAVAWAHRGLDLQLQEVAPNESLAHAAQSVDRFLESGERFQAAISAVSVACRLRWIDPGAADTWLERAAEWLDEDDPGQASGVAALEQLRGNLRSDEDEWAGAVDHYTRAIQIRRCLVGDELGLAASLHARAIARNSIKSGDGDSDAKEADELLHAQSDEESTLRREVSQALDKGEGLRDLVERVEASDSPQLLALFKVMLGTLAGEDTESRLTSLDDALAANTNAGDRDQSRHLIEFAIGQVHLEAGAHEPAIAAYKRCLALNPRYWDARQNLVALLQQEEKWEELRDFCIAEVDADRYGPAVMYTLGRALEATGDVQGAADWWGKALRENSQEPMRGLLTDAIITVIQRGAQPPAQTTTESADASALFVALDDFATFVASERRMTFWRRDGDGGHKWVASPEEYGKTVLLTYLRAKWSDLEVLDEVNAGAGRIDLLVRMPNGARVVLELKICGAGYSFPYAADGLDQLEHYMGARATSLGALVVFDGRKRDFGKGLQSWARAGNNTVRVVFVELKPTVS